MPATIADPVIQARRSLRTGLFLLAALVLIGAGIAGLVEASEEILEAIDESDGIAVWDRPVLDWAVANRTPTLVAGALLFTHSGGPIWQPILTLGLALFLWWRWRDPTPMLLIVIVELGALAISLAGKNAVGRVRPPEIDAVPPFETSASFPSGHTLQAFAAATIIAYLLIRRYWDGARWLPWLIGALAFCYATAMAWSRVFLGYHWLTDVLAAAALGMAWAATVIACHRIYWRRSDWRDFYSAAKSWRSVLQPSQ